MPVECDFDYEDDENCSDDEVLEKMSNQGTESGQSCWFIFSFLVLWKVYQNTVSIQAKGLEGWQSPPDVGKFSKISSFR